MKVIRHILAISFFLIIPYSLATGQTTGHVGFFFISQVKTNADFEVHDDFQYHHKQIIPWLVKNGFSFSYHSAAPITLNLDEGQSITIQRDQLKDELGFILAKRDGALKILYGVHTDVDILMEARDFFDIHQGQPVAKSGDGENLVAEKVAPETLETDLIQLIRNSPTPVLVYIISGGADLFRQLETTMTQLKSDYKENIRIVKVDLSKDYEILNPWRRFEIDDVPTVILFSGGKEKYRLVGGDAVTRKEIDRMLRKSGAAVRLPKIRCHSFYIGMLEQRKSNWPREPSKDDDYEHRVRILFAKSDSGWESVLDCPGWKATYPKKVEWTVAFDGRDLGKLESEDISDSASFANFFARDKIQKPNSTYKIPKVGKPTTEFSGWMGGAYLRPLVVVSANNYKDPQKWKPYKPSQSEIHRIMPLFREVVGKVMRCEAGSHTSIPFNYADNDVSAFKSYRAITGEAIISIGFHPEQIKCGGVPGEHPEWTPQWFYISPDKEVTHIGNRMRLVDAGDYDNDGVSEVVFWADRYNLDGYIMFFDGFAKNTDYMWSYH